MVVPEYPPDVIGGGGTVFAALAECFRARHEVAVFAAWDARRNWAEPPTLSCVDGVDVRRYPLAPVLRSMPNLRSVLPPNPRGVAGLWTELRRWAPHVGHLHGYGYTFVDLGAALLRRSGTPYVFTFHGVPTTQAAAAGPVRGAYRAYERFGLRRTVAGAASTTAVSPEAAGRWPVDRVIPNGVAATTPAVAPEAIVALRSRLEVRGDAPLVVGIGRLARTKGFDLLIRASDLLAASDAVIILAGADGGAEPNLRVLAARATRRVVFTGQLGRYELGVLLAAAAVVVVPSRDEPFGLVPLEAFQAGVRVVATDVGGLRLTVRPPLGELVASDDVPGLASAINRALGAGGFDASERRAADAQLEEFSWAGIAKEYEAVLTRAANREVGAR